MLFGAVMKTFIIGIIKRLLKTNRNGILPDVNNLPRFVTYVLIVDVKTI